MKKTAKTLVIALCIIAICGLVFAFGGCGSKRENVTVSGSSSVTPIMQKLAAEYEKTHNVRITVNMSSSGSGISDTQNGLNDFGMSSRELTVEDVGVKGETLCRDGIVLIVNKNCQITSVSKADVKALFENGTAIPNTSVTAAIGRDGTSGTRKAFDELLGIKNGYAKGVATLAETGNVIETIQGADNSIGYISYGSLGNTVKAVGLDGVDCTIDNIINGSYALQRPFIIVTKENAKLSKAAQGFYDFIFSDEAQKIIERENYISVK